MAQGGPFIFQGDAGAPEGYGAMIRVGITDARFFLDVKDAFLKLQRAGLWWKGLHADLLDGHHAADFQAACDFLTELCTMADNGTGAAVVYDPTADFAIILDATDGLPKFSVVVGGPASATGGNLASYDGTSGKLLADSGVSAASVTNAVTAAAVIVDNTIVVGAGGARGVEDTPVTIDPATGDTDFGTGDLTTDGNVTIGGTALMGDGTDSTIDGDLIVDGKLTVTGEIDPTGIRLPEAAAYPVTVPAGEGGYYVKNTTPSEPGYTDDTNTAHRLMLGSRNLSDLSNASTARTNLSLGNVDNTSDANKPVSTATQTALDLKAVTTRKLDDFGAPDDNTDLNVSTGAHGLCPKLPNDAAVYLDGTGAYTTPPTDEAAIADAVEAYLIANPPNVQAAWPVGSVFIGVVGTDPATLLGFGTWSAIGAGRVLVGQDTGDADFDTLEETGGAKTVTLTAAQSGVPAHTHTATDSGHVHAQNSPTSASGGTVKQGIDTNASGTQASVQNTASGTADITVNANATAAASAAHTNVQPYFVVCMWKRTA